MQAKIEHLHDMYKFMSQKDRVFGDLLSLIRVLKIFKYT